MLRLHGTCNSPAVPASWSGGLLHAPGFNVPEGLRYVVTSAFLTELHNPTYHVPGKHSAAMSHVQNDKYMDDFDKAWEQMHRMHVESGSTGPGPFQ